MATAIRTARSAGSGTGTGSLKKIIMPSPVKRSSVPSCSRISLPISAWYSRSTPMTSSGSAVSAKAVKPRRSRKTTVTSRRWVLSGSSAPPATISSASCGEKKRLSRPSRSSCATCSRTRCSRVRFSSASSSYKRLDPQQRAHAGQQLRLVDGLGQEVVGPGLDPLDPLLAGIERGHHHHRQDAGAGVGPDPSAHLVAAHLGHHHVQQHEVEVFLLDDGQRLAAGGGGDARRTPWPAASRPGA